MLRLDIFSDPVCPWCYIGKTLLDRALESRAEHPFAVEWHPFQLNPDMPAGGMDRQAYLAAKFGGPERAAAVYGRSPRPPAPPGSTSTSSASPARPTRSTPTG